MNSTVLAVLTSTVTSAFTTAAPVDKIPTAYGYLCVAISVLFFGSNLVPVKKFETGDGMFFQWVMCSAIWITGLIVQCIRHFPTFYPLAMLGGALWCTGNTMTVPIIKTIGLGQGMLIWASVCLLSGWASGRFGWFGLHPELPTNPVFNYVGVGLCLVSAVVYMFLKTNMHNPRQETITISEDEDPLLSQTETLNGSTLLPTESDVIFFERLHPVVKRVLGTVAAIVAGLFYGLNFAPVIYVIDNYKNSSQNGLDYVFAHFCGIYLASTAYFTVYCAVMCNRPRVYHRAILPGLVSGAMWGVAQIGWFIANDTLSEPISFPIISTVPALIAALWGLFFKEITGKRNLVVLGVACVFAISGATLTGLSKLAHGGATSNVTTTTWPTTTAGVFAVGQT